ncbi:MAG: UbiX family flavin prenyltransferase [Planctomycetota bacterium]|jgi:polyprenyl P-hydroxybenzoate/phenylacrylic acid decarboxylase-like protein
MSTPKQIVVGISGASGAVYAQRLIAALVEARAGVHLIVSPLGQRLLHDELGMEGVDLEALAGRPDHGITYHHYRDVGAAVASGSFRHDGMVIVPCSNNTLAATAHGLSENLLHRAASVSLKERFGLILAHRETPLSLIEINNMKAVTEAGAIVTPLNPGFYMLPESIDQLVDFMVGKLLDQLSVPHNLHTRWTESPANRQATKSSSSES